MADECSHALQVDHQRKLDRLEDKVDEMEEKVSSIERYINGTNGDAGLKVIIANVQHDISSILTSLLNIADSNRRRDEIAERNEAQKKAQSSRATIAFVGVVLAFFGNLLIQYVK